MFRQALALWSLFTQLCFQAEVYWLREQLDRERSRSNSAPSETRRLALETAQKHREVVGLQGQVASLRQHLLEAEAALHSQKADLAVCKRAQLQDDWTRYASTRKRLLTSMVSLLSSSSIAHIQHLPGGQWIEPNSLRCSSWDSSAMSSLSSQAVHMSAARQNFL